MILAPWLWNFATHRRTKVALVCLPFFLMVLVPSLYWLVNWKGERDAERQLEWLKSQGLAVTFEEYFPQAGDAEHDFLQHPAVIGELARPDDERLNRINRERYGSRFQGFANQVKKPTREMAELYDVRQFFDPVRHATEAEAAREILDELAPERARMKGIAQASERPELSWNLKWEDFGGVSLPVKSELFKLMGFACFASNTCLLHLALDESEEAADLVVAMLNLRRLICQQEPNLISCLIGAMVHYECQSMIQEGIMRGSWTEDMLSRFEQHLVKQSPHLEFIRSLDGEVCQYSWSIQLIRSRKTTPKLDLLDGWEADREAVLRRIRGLWWGIRPTGMSLSEMAKGSKGLVNEGLMKNGVPRQRFEWREKQDFSMRHDALPRADLGGVDDVALDGSHLQLLSMAAEKSHQAEMMTVLLRTGIALERHRLKHGGNPENLDALAPEFLPAVPNDPYDGKPLRYRRQSDGAPVVWSVGPDLVDDGGRSDSSQNAGDEVWVTRPLEGFSTKDTNRR